MNITTVFAILAFIVLLFIAAELYVIARELSRFLTLRIKEGEVHEAQTPGQTINVNLAPQSSTSPVVTTIAPVVSNTTELQPAPVVPPVEEKVALESRTVISSPFAVKCKKCNAENSSYRGECFNCGATL